MYLFDTFGISGLDVCGFGQFKRRPKDERAMHASNNGARIDKMNILQLISEPLRNTFTPELVCRGFELTGVIPFNPEAIPLYKLAPSQISSTKQFFPGHVLPEVTAMTAAFSQLKRKTRPSSPQQSPSKRRRLGEIDTNLPQPSVSTTFESSQWDISPENARIATCLLRETSVQSLFTDSPLSADFSMPKPTFYIGEPFNGCQGFVPSRNPGALSHNGVLAENVALREQTRQLIDSNHTFLENEKKTTVQMVLQHIALKKLTDQLNATKLGGAKKESFPFKDGKACLLTSPDVINQLELRKAEQFKAEEDKAKRKEAMQTRRKLRDSIGVSKDLFKKQCMAEIQAWQTEIDKLKAFKVPKKEFPKKPYSWKQRVKPYQYLLDELEALKQLAPDKTEVVEIVDEQDSEQGKIILVEAIQCK